MHATLHSRISHLYMYNLVWLRFATTCIIRVRATIKMYKEKNSDEHEKWLEKNHNWYIVSIWLGLACIICIITEFSIRNSHGRGSLRINKAVRTVYHRHHLWLRNPFSYISIENSSNSITSAIFYLDFSASSMLDFNLCTEENVGKFDRFDVAIVSSTFCIVLLWLLFSKQKRSNISIHEIIL